MQEVSTPDNIFINAINNLEFIVLEFTTIE